MSDDEAYLIQVKKLVDMANRALDEAQSWTDEITNPDIKKEAEDYIDNSGLNNL